MSRAWPAWPRASRWKGLATEACRASLEFGFATLGLERILGLVLPENAASIRVLEKVGMRPDGTVEYGGQRALRYVAGAAGPVVAPGLSGPPGIG